jgi:uncharacterized OB-fold protein
VTAADRPLPAEHPVTAPWWEATRDRRLLVQHCRDCGNHQHYPRPVCVACGGEDLEFVPASGAGTVYSFTVVHRAPHPAFAAPYVVALVRLAEGPVLLTRLVGAPVEALACDQPVRVGWDPLPDGRHLPVFTPSEG